MGLRSARTIARGANALTATWRRKGQPAHKRAASLMSSSTRAWQNKGPMRNFWWSPTSKTLLRWREPAASCINRSSKKKPNACRGRLDCRCTSRRVFPCRLRPPRPNWLLLLRRQMTKGLPLVVSCRLRPPRPNWLLLLRRQMTKGLPLVLSLVLPIFSHVVESCLTVVIQRRGSSCMKARDLWATLKWKRISLGHSLKRLRERERERGVPVLALTGTTEHGTENKSARSRRRFLGTKRHFLQKLTTN